MSVCDPRPILLASATSSFLCLCHPALLCCGRNARLMHQVPQGCNQSQGVALASVSLPAWSQQFFYRLTAPRAAAWWQIFATILLSSTYGSTLVKPPPTPIPALLEMPVVVAAPLPNEIAPLEALL